MNPTPLIRDGERLKIIEISSLKEIREKQKQPHRRLTKPCVREGLLPARKSKTMKVVDDAWHRLKTATWSVDTLCDVIIVLSFTSPSANCRLMRQNRLSQTPCDIRRQLSDPEIVKQILRDLAPLWSKAVQRLHRQKLHGLEKLSLAPNPEEKCINLFLYSRCGIEADTKHGSMPFLHGKATVQDVSQLIDWLEYAGLLEHSEVIVPALLKLAENIPTASAWRWCQILLEHPENNILHRVTLLLQHNMETVTLDDRAFDLFQTIDGIDWLAEGLSPNYVWECTIRGLKNGVSMDILSRGIQLARHGRQVPKFHLFRGEFPIETFLEIQSRIIHCYGYGGFRFCCDVFQTLGQHPGAARFFDAPSLQALRGPNYRSVVSFLCHKVKWGQQNAFDTEKMRLLCNFVLEVDTFTFGDLLGLAEQVANGYIRKRKCAFEAALTITRRYERLDLNITSWMVSFWYSCIIAAINSGQLAVFSEMADSVYKKVHKAFCSENKMERIVPGNRKFCHHSPSDALKMLQHFPTKYLDTVMQLNDSGTEAYHVLDCYSRHPINETDLHRTGLADIELLVRSTVAGTSFKNPLPERLRQYTVGERELEQKIVQRDLAEFDTRILYYRLEILGQEIARSLDQSYKVETSHFSSHTLALAKDIDDNRRAMRRYIRIASSGIDVVKNHILQHPTNRRWLEHKKEHGVRTEAWLEGQSFVFDTKKFGPVAMYNETHPGEILKMGTYVGSCLSLGGCFSSSTVANLYDINKMVIFARDRKGKVIARQLLAVSENLELVCFPVYPYGIDTEVRMMFYEYDRLLSMKTNLPIFKDIDNGDYTIKPLVCRFWYDDGAINVPEKTLAA